jgi:hypothetical protein
VERKPPNAGKGRPKGSVNKVNADVKAMVLEALHHAGGAEYLYMHAIDNPKAFMTLVGRVLPMTINATVDVNDRAEQMRLKREARIAARRPG